MDCLEGILKRRSIRKFTDENIKEEELEALLNSAISAPSPHNEQPWEFLILKEKHTIEKLASKLKEEYIKSGKADEEKAERTYRIVSSAKVILIGFLNIKKLRSDSHNERLMGMQSLAAAAENVLIAANCLGLGAHWRAIPLVRPDIFSDMFRIPDYVEPQWMILLGRPGALPKPKYLQKEGVFHFNGWA
ncbi:MAG: nitroreductase family protein [Conexivisphaerales archaeon]|nr:nitroreductase family protein [Conexivisphaerales archaeon]